MTTNLGVVFVPQLPPERLGPVVRAADEAGLDELWLWEDCFLESGIASAAAAAAWSRRLRVGVGLLPVPLRNVALTAMELATMNRLFPDRIRIGVGHGVQDWMGQVGARVDSPLTLLREYLAALRALLRGEEVTAEGRYVRLDRVALGWPPATAPAVLAGASGARSLELTGECADGTILTAGTTVAGMATALAAVGRGRAAAAGAAAPHQVIVYLHAAIGPDAAGRLEAERRRWGYERIDDRSVSGEAEQVAAGVRRWAEAGAGTVVLQPTPDDPDLEGFVRFVAERVRPLVD